MTTIKDNARGGPAPSPGFGGVRKPSTDFDAVQTKLQTHALYVDVDLTNARSLAAGTALRLDIIGNAIFADQKASSGSATLFFQDDAYKGNTPITMFPGAVFKIGFTFVMLENAAQAGKTLRLIYGVDIDFQQAVGAGVFGEVSVLDGGQARTIAGQAFWSYADCPAVAAQYSHVQLWNHVGAAIDKNVIIKQLWITSPTMMDFYVGCNATQLANPWNIPPSKLAGGAASANVTGRSEGKVVNMVPTGHFARLAANVTYCIRLNEPIVVPPGFGCFIGAGTVNITLNGAFEFIEQAIAP